MDETMKLIDVICAAIGDDSEDKSAALQTAADAGYGRLDGSEEARYAGTCWDGNNRADVWYVEGGYHTSAQSGEIFEDSEPEGFESKTR